MKSILSFSLVLVISTTLLGCATIFNSGSQTIMVRTGDGSENVNVEVQTSNGMYSAKIPTMVVSEPSHAGVTIRVTDKCYDNITVKVNESVTPSFWANFLWIIWFPVGMGIDAISADMWKYDQNVVIPLNKKESCSK